MACNNCQKVISDSDSVTCRGYCGNSYHMLCVRLDLPREVLETHKRNLFWMCDQCADLFSNEHFRKMTSGCNNGNVHDDVSLESIKDDISGLKEIVKTLTTKIESKPLTPLFNDPRPKPTFPFPVPNTPKRIREDRQGSQFKPSNMRGTKTASELVKTVAPPEDLLWIYLSAFHPNTSENDIANLARDCLDLGTDAQPKVVKLVPRDMDPGKLTYVTFKVGVSKSIKDKALSTDTWPENVYFREFENLSKNSRRVIRIAASNSQSGGGGQ